MLRFVDPHDGDTPANHIDLVDAAWRLCKAPICGQRLIDQLNQQGTIHTGMANQDDRVLNVSIENEPKRIRATGNHVLQRFAVRESNQMRGGEPCGEKFRIGLLDFLIAPQLPRAIIDVVEFINGLGFNATRLGDSMAGFDAPFHWTGIDLDWLPRGRDAPRNGLGFGSSVIGQRQISTTAKAFWFNAFDMAMSDQENFRQCLSLALSG